MRSKDRRREQRVRRRLSAELKVDGRRHHAVVQNLASSGLFVQTRTKPLLGQEVEVGLRVSTQTKPIVLRAVVARAFLVPPALVGVAGGGIGLRIRSAPHAYSSFLAGIAPHGWAPSLPPSGRPPRDMAVEIELQVELNQTPASDAQLQRFRVRACRTDGSRPTTLVLACSCEAEAHQEMLAHLGDGWKVVELEEA
jgi:Tfp pilus assembly protein PilZ